MKLRIIFAIFILNFPAWAMARGMWVAVSVYDGRNHGINEYYGKIDEKSLDGMLAKVDDNAMFKITDTFWTNSDGSVVFMSDAKKYGRKLGYTNTVYFRQSSVVRIVPLNKNYVDKMIGK